jgi:glycosyltransferase involved in cell wall biosynthesis
MKQLIISKGEVFNQSLIITGQQHPELSIIIPAYNEEKTIDNILKRTKCVAEDLCLRHEIIVVDDGSTDLTQMIVGQNKVKLVSFHENQGKGAALRAGLHMAKGDIIVFMDSDGSHQPEEIPLLINPIMNGESNAVLGCRFNSKREAGALAFLNTLGNIFFNSSIFLLTGRYFTDTQSGFRAIKSNIARKLNLDSEKYEVESEMLIELVQMKCKIKEIGITCKKSSRPSYLSLLSDGIRIFEMILLKSLNKKKSKRVI